MRMGEAGVIVPPHGYLQALRELCDDTGALLVFDCVQTGMGRTGDWFGYEYSGIKPDVITLAKGLGGGLPLGAMIALGKASHLFEAGDHGSTFGGNPVSAAIGQTVLDVIVDEALQRNALTVGNYLMDGVRELGKSIETIGDVRGSGLFIGVEFVTDRASQSPGTQITKDLIEFARENGVFLSSDGPAENVLKIKPPMIIGKAEVDQFLDVLQRGLSR